MEALKLYQPINVLKPVAENLWMVDGPLIKMAFLGFHLPFSTRMTVVRLQNGELFLHSPIAYHAPLAKELEELGRIRHLVSPSKIHYAGIPQWQKHYPDTISWASPGVKERAASQNIAVHFDRDLKESPPEEWAKELDQLEIKGSFVFKEIVFFHRASKTAILTDLIENFEMEKVNHRFLRFILKIAGGVHPKGTMPIDIRSTFFGHKEKLREGIRRLLEWNPEKVILSHGKWYPENGRREIERAFRWLL